MEKESEIRVEIKKCLEFTRDSHNLEIYASVQIYLGNLYRQIKETEQAEKVWKNIQRTDSNKLYAYAQFNLAVLFREADRFSEMCIAYGEIMRSDDASTYADAQFNLAVYFLSIKNIDDARTAFLKIEPQDKKFYDAQMGCQILNLDDEKQRNTLIKIHDTVEEILLSLFIQQNDVDEKVAHYTTTDAAFKMLSETPSPLRIATIQYVNDPTEGKMILDYLGMSYLNCELPTQSQSDFHTFITCFSFNHDWLNQFRLYGKTKNQEASGVSLIFQHRLFSQEHNIASQAGYISFLNSPVNNASREIEDLDRLEYDEKKAEANPNEEFGKTLNLYRCIYFDPKTQLLKLAHRDEWTFFREAILDSSEESNKAYEIAREKWVKYLKQIKKKEKKIFKYLNLIKKLIGKLLNPSSLYAILCKLPSSQMAA